MSSHLYQIYENVKQWCLYAFKHLATRVKITTTYLSQICHKGLQYWAHERHKYWCMCYSNGRRQHTIMEINGTIIAVKMSNIWPQVFRWRPPIFHKCCHNCYNDICKYIRNIFACFTITSANMSEIRPPVLQIWTQIRHTYGRKFYKNVHKNVKNMAPCARIMPAYMSKSCPHLL